MPATLVEIPVQVPAGDAELEGNLVVPSDA